MTRIFSSFVSSLLIAAPLFALTACPEQGPPKPPPVHDDETVVSAVEGQLKAAESKGWSPAEEATFGASIANLSLEKRLDLGRRLARELTFGQIKMQAPAAPPADAPTCTCAACAAGGAGGTPGQGPPATTRTGRETRPLAK